MPKPPRNHMACPVRFELPGRKPSNPSPVVIAPRGQQWSIVEIHGVRLGKAIANDNETSLASFRHKLQPSTFANGYGNAPDGASN